MEKKVTIALLSIYKTLTETTYRVQINISDNGIIVQYDEGSEIFPNVNIISDPDVVLVDQSEGIPTAYLLPLGEKVEVMINDTNLF